MTPEAPMTEGATLAFAKVHLVKHGLWDWAVKLDNAKRRNGCCNYTNRTLSFSRQGIAVRKGEQTRMTVLHEIAHALTPGHGHDRTWAAKCREIGGDGQRCGGMDAAAMAAVAAAAPYVGTCGKGHTYPRHRRPSIKPGAYYICPKDRTRIEFSVNR